MAYANLLLEKRDGVAVVTINRPDKLNALNAATLDGLLAAFEAAAADPAVRCVVLTGAGAKAFVAGADIAEMNTLTPVQGRDFSLRGQKLMRRIEKMPKPVVAMINGFALGGGLELAMGCHLRIAADTAKVGQPEIATERDGTVRVRYAGTRPERRVAAWRVFDAQQDLSAIDGAIVLVGASAAALADVRATPLEAAVPGVDIHAELIEHVLAGRRDFDHSIPLLEQGLEMQRGMSNTEGVVRGLEGYAVALATAGLARQAALLFDACTALRHRFGTERVHVEERAFDRQFAPLYESLGADVRRQMAERAEGMSLDQAIAFAVDAGRLLTDA